MLNQPPPPILDYQPPDAMRAQEQPESAGRKVMRFYGHFAAAYGTCWLVMLSLALLTQSRINSGLFGLLGFPALAAIYAVIRIVTKPT